MRRNSKRSGTRVALAAGLFASAAVALGGCGRPTADQEALAKSRRSMLALTGGADAATVTARKQVQTEVLGSLKGVPERLSQAGEQAAAWMLTAQAQAGLAQIDAETATTLERQRMGLVAEARSLAGLYDSHEALAAAMESKDFGPDLASLDGALRETDALAGEAAKAKADAEQRVAGLEAAAKARLDQAREARDAEQKARDGARQAAAEARAALYEQAYEAGRRADGFEKEASDLQAQAAVFRPQVAVALVDIDRARRQREMLTLSRKAVEERASQAKQQAAAVRAESAKAAEQFAAVVKRIEDLTAGDLGRAYDSAVSGYGQAQQAMSKAVQAAGEDKAPLAVAIGQFAQAAADLHSSRARGLGVVRDVLAWSASLKPAMPAAAQVSALLAAVNEKHAAAVASAGQAYDKARSALNGSGARGEIAERLKAVSAMLPGAPPPPPAEEPAPQPPPNELPPEGEQAPPPKPGPSEPQF